MKMLTCFAACLISVYFGFYLGRKDHEINITIEHEDDEEPQALSDYFEERRRNDDRD